VGAQVGSELTAERFISELEVHRSATERAKLMKYFKTGPGEYGEGDDFIGVRMGTLFDVSKRFTGMSVHELETLLESPVHEVRAGALSIMNQAAMAKRTPEARRKELFDLYLRRHDRINNWDLVDVACRYVVGVYLADKPRDVLYSLARSQNVWERRTAIVSTWWFIRAGDLDDTFALSEILVDDEHDLIHKATGWMLRYAGDKDRDRLCEFLDRHAATMPRTLLRYSIEKFPPELRAHYLGLRTA
jgi:3-methyladenine DNA glycosylase AlkD